MASFPQQLSLPRLKAKDSASSWSNELRKDSEVLLEDTPLAPTTASLSVARPQDVAAAEFPLPATSLIQTFPKWVRVTRLWFEGEATLNQGLSNRFPAA